MTLSLSWGRIVNSTLYPVNFANSYLDLSSIYGVDNATARKLRTFKDGKLITGDFIGNGGAYNTALNNVSIKNFAPASGKVGLSPHLLPPEIKVDDGLVSGDLRCSENIQLPELTDDETIFQYARKIVIGEYQHIIFEEYLPSALGVEMPPYSASGTNGNGVDNIIVSMLRATSAEFDLEFSSTLRNMPGVIDLAAVDIARGMYNLISYHINSTALKLFLSTSKGRLLGLPDYDTFRAVYHPAGSVYSNPNCTRSDAQDSVNCFNIITNNITIATKLQKIYGKVNRVDAFIGTFAESKNENAPLPPTITAMIREEFLQKRSSDRFWYEGSKYTTDEIELIKQATMRDIIMRNT
ncbi:2225_t:CDS:2, partial [Racocetra fulgida]